MSRAICLSSLVFAVAVTVGFLGCGRSEQGLNPQLVETYRAQLTLTEEPDGAMVVPDVREALLGTSDEHADHDHDADHDEHDHEHADGHEEHAGHEDDEHADHDTADDDDQDEEDSDEDEDGDKDEDGDDDEDEGDDAEQESDDEDEDQGDEHSDHQHEEHAEHERDEHDHDADGHDEHAEPAHSEQHADHDEHEAHAHEPAVITEDTEPMDVVLVGQIGGLTNPWQETQPDFPFAKNQAAFFLADPLAVVENEESGHNHAPGEECAFCAAHAADRSAMLAMVRFLDEKGDVLQTDLRQLFDVKEKDTVVVRGTARVVAGGMMVVDATGLYVRR